MRYPLRPHQIESLKASYLGGMSFWRAGSMANTTGSTAWRYFQKFAADGLVRGALRRKPYMRTRGPEWPEPYTGPAIIGKAIGTPPDPTGPDWIGHAIAP